MITVTKNLTQEQCSACLFSAVSAAASMPGFATLQEAQDYISREYFRDVLSCCTPTERALWAAEVIGVEISPEVIAATREGAILEMCRGYLDAGLLSLVVVVS